MEIKESRASNIFFKETIEKIENSGKLDNRKKLSEILLCSLQMKIFLSFIEEYFYWCFIPYNLLIFSK